MTQIRFIAATLLASLLIIIQNASSKTFITEKRYTTSHLRRNVHRQGRYTQIIRNAGRRRRNTMGSYNLQEVMTHNLLSMSINVSSNQKPSSTRPIATTTTTASPSSKILLKTNKPTLLPTPAPAMPTKKRPSIAPRAKPIKEVPTNSPSTTLTATPSSRKVNTETPSSTTPPPLTPVVLTLSPTVSITPAKTPQKAPNGVQPLPTAPSKKRPFQELKPKRSSTPLTTVPVSTLTLSPTPAANDNSKTPVAANPVVEPLQNNIKSYSPSNYTWRLNFSMSCDTNNITQGPGTGISDSICIPSPSSLLSQPIAILYSVSIIELDLDLVPVYDQHYNNVNFNDTTFTYTSIGAKTQGNNNTKNLTRISALGGIQMRMIGKTELGVEVTVTWTAAYSNNCTVEVFFPGNTLGLVVFDEVGPPINKLCTSQKSSLNQPPSSNQSSSSLFKNQTSMSNNTHTSLFKNSTVSTNKSSATYLNQTSDKKKHHSTSSSSVNQTSLIIKGGEGMDQSTLMAQEPDTAYETLRKKVVVETSSDKNTISASPTTIHIRKPSSRPSTHKPDKTNAVMEGAEENKTGEPRTELNSSNQEPSATMYQTARGKDIATISSDIMMNGSGENMDESAVLSSSQEPSDTLHQTTRGKVIAKISSDMMPDGSGENKDKSAALSSSNQEPSGALYQTTRGKVVAKKSSDRMGSTNKTISEPSTTMLTLSFKYSMTQQHIAAPTSTKLNRDTFDQTSSTGRVDGVGQQLNEAVLTSEQSNKPQQPLIYDGGK